MRTETEIKERLENYKKNNGLLKRGNISQAQPVVRRAIMELQWVLGIEERKER